jgi:hypothetical protein
MGRWNTNSQITQAFFVKNFYTYFQVNMLKDFFVGLLPSEIKQKIFLWAYFQVK